MTGSELPPTSRPWRTVATYLAVTAGLVVGAAGLAAVTDPSPVVPTRPVVAAEGSRLIGPQGRDGQFVVRCDYSHSAPDDPIVHRNMPGMSHRHDFFGSTLTDSSSTADSLLDGPTTCRKSADTAAYWAPSLLDRGVPVVPEGSVAYYRAAPGVDPTTLEVPPHGLKVVSGDFTAQEPQPLDVAGWGCGVSSDLAPSPRQKVCPATAPLRLTVTFPDCWNGRDLDSADHRSHLASSRRGVCPRSHPVPLPQLTFAVKYPISGADHDLTLASGSEFGAHADFFNAWDQDGLRREVEHCLHRDVVCNLSSNREEEALFMTR